MTVGAEADCKELDLLNMASGNESEVLTSIEATDDDWEPPLTYYHPTDPSFDLSKDVGLK